MNLPRVYTCSQSWTPLPPPSPYHPSGSSQCTRSKYPVSCIKPGLAIHFLYDIIHVSMTFSQITTRSPQSPSFVLKHWADFIPDHTPVHPSLCLGGPSLFPTPAPGPFSPARMPWCWTWSWTDWDRICLPAACTPSTSYTQQRSLIGTGWAWPPSTGADEEWAGQDGAGDLAINRRKALTNIWCFDLFICRKLMCVFSSSSMGFGI